MMFVNLSFSDLMKITHMQQVEAATAEERLLNMNFMKNKSRDLARQNKVAQVLYV